MIIPDVNVLVYAFLSDEPEHGRYAEWLADASDSDEPIGLVDAAVVGFVRVVSNRRIFPTPARAATAVAFIDAILSNESARWIAPTRSTWERFRQIVDTDRQVSGTLVPDAWLAAMAISHGGRLATADRGFARFQQLDWFDPGR